MQKTKFFVCRGNVGATVEAVVTAPQLRHMKNLGEWHLDSADDADDGWYVPMTMVKEWLGNEVENWKKKLPAGMGGFVDKLTPEDVYQMILDREFGLEDLTNWLDMRDFEKSHKEFEKEIKADSLKEEEDTQMVVLVEDWNPLDYTGSFLNMESDDE